MICPIKKCPLVMGFSKVCIEEAQNWQELKTYLFDLLTEIQKQTNLDFRFEHLIKTIIRKMETIEDDNTRRSKKDGK